jgi:hypothetical protein
MEQTRQEYLEWRKKDRRENLLAIIGIIVFGLILVISLLVFTTPLITFIVGFIYFAFCFPIIFGFHD